MAATKASAVSWPTPGNRHQPPAGLRRALETLHVGVDRDDRLRARRCARRAAPASRRTRPAIPRCRAIACSAKAGTQPARQPDPEHHRQAADLVLERDALADQLLACDDQRADGMRRQRLHVDRLEEAGAGQDAPARAHHCGRSCASPATSAPDRLAGSRCRPPAAKRLRPW